MSTTLDSLNLRPQEKRVLVGLAVVVFVVLNLVLVVPRFKDYGILKKELAATKDTIDKYNRFIYKDTNSVDGYQKVLKDLSKAPEGKVSSTEIQLEQTVTREAAANGLFIQTIQNVASQVIGSSGQSDKFFARQSVRVTIQATEDALVKFLYDVGNDPAMIRVWELQLNPADNNRYKLNATMLLTADYQKEVPTNAAPVKSASLVKNVTPQGPTNVPAKTAAPAPTNAVQKTAARSAGANPTNTNPNPAAVRRGFSPPPAPPAPGQSAAPPASGRTGGPQAPNRLRRGPPQESMTN
jgi:hypothetical protein